MEVFIAQSNSAWATLSNQDQALTVRPNIEQAQADLANQNAGFSYAESTMNEIFNVAAAGDCRPRKSSAWLRAATWPLAPGLLSESSTWPRANLSCSLPSFNPFDPE